MKRTPTKAGLALTAHASGELVTGLLFAMGWRRVGRSDARLPILSPGPNSVQSRLDARRVVISGWVLHVQLRNDQGHWETVDKVGALSAIRTIGKTGRPDAIFGAVRVTTEAP